MKKGDNSNYQWQSRTSRALTQRIYLMHDQTRMGSDSEFHFKVMGTTDNAYDVVIEGDTASNTVYCSCPDHSQRGNFCKHLIFIMIRVLGIPSHDIHTDYEDCFDTSDLTIEACRRFFATREDALKMIAKEEEKRKPIEDDDECPICYEGFKETAKEPTVWCKAACGKSTHTSCFLRWSRANGRNAVTCVYCRAPWKH